MSAHVLGLDLGLAHAGAAALYRGTDGAGPIYTWHKQSEKPRCAEGHERCSDHEPLIEDVADRILRMARWAVERATASTVLAVIEGPAHAAQYGQPHERAAVWWRVVDSLLRQTTPVPVAVLSPSTNQAYITGKGRASKEEVQRAVALALPGQGLARVTEHEADAASLALAGADWLGWPGPWLDGRRGSGWLKKAWWPDREQVHA